MRRTSRAVVWVIAAMGVGWMGCRPSAPAVTPAPAPTVSAPRQCDEAQERLSSLADLRASPWSVKQHCDRHFADQKVAWLIPEPIFQKYIVDARATYFGRCQSGLCYQFASPTSAIYEAVRASMKDGKHDPEILGQALGLPASNLAGPLRLVTLDLATEGMCRRFPIEEDPGVWKCTGPDDRQCFKFGGYTSGGLPELILVNAPVSRAKIEVIP